MSSITPYYRTVQDLLQSRSFSIDEYQREYKWEKKNINELLSDLRDKFIGCYQAGDDTKRVATYEDYFLGSIIVSKRGTKSYLVDGQQRVTSLSLLLIHMYRVADAAGMKVVERIAPLIFSDNYGEPDFNLDIPERRPVLDALFKGLPFDPTEKEESVQTMYARYADIEAADLAGELGDALPHFIYWLMTKVGLIEITTDNDNYAYAIFETMNDRGKPLSPVDMLKAYLLAPIEKPEDRRLANQTWKKQVLDLITWNGIHEHERDSNCIKAWFRAQYSESIRERKANATDKDWELIASVFHRWARDNRTRLGLGSAAQNMAFMTEDLPFFSSAYQLILAASAEYTPGLEAVFYNAHNEFTWQPTVLLAPLTKRDDRDTVRKKIAVTATYLDIWLMRRTVNYVRVAYASTSYAMYLLCKDIRQKSLDELVMILTERLAKDEVTFEGMERKGRTGISGLGLNQFSKRYIYHLLARVTTYVEVGSDRPDRFAEYTDRESANPFDIEHIWADQYDRFHDRYKSEHDFHDARNQVGALLLLPADVNRSLQDLTYEEKLPHYEKQNLFAASLAKGSYARQPRFEQFCTRTSLEFKPHEHYDEKDIEQRTALLQHVVELVWSPDRLKAAAQ